jgi:hypothetical protein
MNELTPINNEPQIQESNQFKPIEESKETNEVSLPSLKNKPKQSEELITSLPEWSIEPPIEIKRG